MNLVRKPCLEEVCLFLCVPQIGCIVSEREVLYERHDTPVGEADLLGAVVHGGGGVAIGSGGVFMRGGVEAQLVFLVLVASGCYLTRGQNPLESLFHGHFRLASLAN